MGRWGLVWFVVVGLSGLGCEKEAKLDLGVWATSQAESQDCPVQCGPTASLVSMVNVGQCDK